MKSDLQSQSSDSLQDPWRKKKTVRIISAIDVVFGVALVALYTYKIIFLDRCSENCQQGIDCFSPQRIIQGEIYMRIVTVLSLLLLISVNCIQISSASKMFNAVTTNKMETATCVEKCKGWVTTTKPIFVLFTIKFMFSILFILASGNEKNIFLAVFIGLTISEWLFKLFAFYKVDGFIKDISTFSSKPDSVASFNCYNLSSGVVNPIYDTVKGEIDIV